MTHIYYLEHESPFSAIHDALMLQMGLNQSNFHIAVDVEAASLHVANSHFPIRHL